MNTHSTRSRGKALAVLTAAGLALAAAGSASAEPNQTPESAGALRATALR